MKTVSKIMLVTAASVLAVSANAAVSYGASNVGQPYIGVKVGQIDTDIQGAPKATTYGVYGGYNFDQNFGVELEYQGSETKGYNFNGLNYEYDAKSYGAYGTYRYNFNATPFYAKGKLGIARTELEDKGVGHSYNQSIKDTSLAGGVGLGYAPNQNFGVEAGYSYLSGEANAITLGAHLAF